VDLAGGDPGQVALPLLRSSVPHDRRAHGVDGQERHWHPGDRGLVGEDELVEHGPVASPVLRGPAQGQPAVAAELADDGAVRLPVAVVAAGLGEAAAHLRGHQAGEILPELPAEQVLLGRVGQVHPLSAAGTK
jgi:hypothetical protein